MDALSSKFEAALEYLGCNFAQSLSFPIGGEEKIYLADHRKPNGAYIENGVERAFLLYNALPAAPGILKIQGSPGSPLFPRLREMGFPSPDEITPQALFWEIPPKPLFLRMLFREIIKSEMSPEGLEELCGTVFFLNTDLPFLFQLPDDRSAQVLIREVPVHQVPNCLKNGVEFLSI